MEKLAGHAAGDGMEVDASEDPAGGVRALVNDCKFTMNLEMANSAWKQVIWRCSVLSGDEGGNKGRGGKTKTKKKTCSLGSIMSRITFPWPPSC